MKIYGLQKCSTTQKYLKWIAAEGKAFSFTDYSVEKPTVQTILAWSKSLGGYEKLINRAGYTWKGIDDSRKQNLDEKSAAKLIHEFTSLIRRPLIVYRSGDVTVGFNKDIAAKIQAE